MSHFLECTYTELVGAKPLLKSDSDEVCKRKTSETYFMAVHAVFVMYGTALLPAYDLTFTTHDMDMCFFRQRGGGQGRGVGVMPGFVPLIMNQRILENLNDPSIILTVGAKSSVAEWEQNSSKTFDQNIVVLFKSFTSLSMSFISS